MKAYEGHSADMQGVRSYGDHCRHSKRACVPGSLELGVVNGMTYLLQDYIRRGICEVNVDEWDDVILVQVIVYDDVVEQKRYKAVRDMFPNTALKATRDNKTWEELFKPINILVELGSKDSVEYRNSEEYKKEHHNQANTGKEKEMNMEEAMKNPDALARHSAEEAYDSLLHVAEIMTRTYGTELNDDQKLHAVYAIEAACKAYLDAKACEKAIVNSESWCQDASEEGKSLDEPRYAGEAMIKDDIVRHSMYDLSGAKFNVGPVDFAGYLESIDPSEDNVPTWRSRAVFTVGDNDVQFWFEFDERGSAISNSVKAFDRMIHDGVLHMCFDLKPIEPADSVGCPEDSNE